MHFPNVPDQILTLKNDLQLPEARDPETQLRILTIFGILKLLRRGHSPRYMEANREPALHQHHYLLASRAVGEQGIAAFLLGGCGNCQEGCGESLDGSQDC